MSNNFVTTPPTAASAAAWQRTKICWKCSDLFFLRVEFCEEIIHPPRFVVVFCTKAPGPGGYSVCVHERDYLWDCFSDMVYRFYSHLFVPKTLPPRTVESFKVGNFGRKKDYPAGPFPQNETFAPSYKFKRCELFYALTALLSDP